MRTVIYDAEDMEPITVIDVPGQYLREIEAGKRGPELRFMAMLPLSAMDFRPNDEPLMPTKNGFPDLSVESSIRRAITNPDFGVGCRRARALRCS
jgi:hypothetical protein